MSNKASVAVVIPNWNGEDHLAEALDSVLEQTYDAEVVVVENASTDGSQKILEGYGGKITVLANSKNLGFAGGVNTGIRYALEQGYTYIALFNNDAVANKTWLEELVVAAEAKKDVGMVTGKFISYDGKHYDSVGDYITIWGLPYPTGRGISVDTEYKSGYCFGVSGGASLFRSAMLKEVGLFDEDFFAYYEDNDLCFRAQLAGWKSYFTNAAVARHHIGATGQKIKGFTTYQTLKNLPLLFWKNVPFSLMPTIMPRLALADTAFFFSATARGQFFPALKGVLHALVLIPKKLVERRAIQKNRKVSVEYINSVLVHDLPPNAHKLRALRNRWRKLLGRPAI